MNKYNKRKSTAYMVNFLQVFGHWQAILLRLKREKKHQTSSDISTCLHLPRHVGSDKSSVENVKIVCEIIFKTTRQIQNYNSINSFFLSEMQQDSWTNHTAPTPPKKRNQVDTGIVRLLFQGRRWVEFVLVLHRHSYTTNLPKSACRCPQEGSERPPGGWSEGREGLGSSNSLSQVETH